MENFHRFNFYKELYFKELERRNNMYNLLNIPLSIITALFALNAYMLFEFTNSICFCIELSFYLSIAINMIIFVAFIFLFYQTFRFKLIKTFPEDDFLKLEFKATEDQVQLFESENPEIKIDLETEKENNLCITTINILNAIKKDNNLKAVKVSRLQFILLISAIISIVSIILFTINKFS